MALCLPINPKIYMPPGGLHFKNKGVSRLERIAEAAVRVKKRGGGTVGVFQPEMTTGGLLQLEED